MQEFDLGFRNSLTIHRQEERKKEERKRIESDSGKKVPSLLMLRSLHGMQINPANASTLLRANSPSPALERKKVFCR